MIADEFDAIADRLKMIQREEELAADDLNQQPDVEAKWSRQFFMDLLSEDEWRLLESCLDEDDIIESEIGYYTI